MQSRLEESKFKGEISQVGCLFKLLLLGLVVCEPYGDNARYDFIVDNGGRFLKIQVKSTSKLVTNSRYAVTVGRHYKRRAVVYEPSEVDFVVIHVVPMDRWYVIPLAATNRKTMIYLHTEVGGQFDHFGKYIDAWDQLKS